MKHIYPSLGVVLLTAVLILGIGRAASAQGFTSVTSLNSLTVSAITGEKPQSKVWTYAGRWWMVMPNSSGTQIWRLDGTTWTSVLNIDASTSSFADCKAVGSVTHILLYKGTSSSLISVEYVPASSTYQLWTTRTSTVPISLDAGVETAAIDIDGNGRMWLANAGTTSVYVRWSDSPYSTWSSPIEIATGINDDDICAATAFNGNIGVLWSNQNTQRFGFKYHVAGADPSTWSLDEVPASQSALSIGAGMADDHLNFAVAGDGTLYAAVKTSYNDGSTGNPQIALLIRRPAGTWDDLYEVSASGTRPIVILNEPSGKVKVIYTSSESGGNILYRESSTGSISFGSVNTLMTGTYNNATSTKQSYSGEVVVMAGTGSSVVSVLATDAIPGLVGHWKMDETTGTTSLADASGLSNNATTVTGSPAFVTGVEANAINLNGTSQYATVPDAASLDITNTITMAAWIKCSRIAAATQRIIAKTVMGTTNGYELSLASSGMVFARFNQQTSGDIYRVNSVTAYTLNGSAWMHVAATYDGSYIRIYINGVQDAISSSVQTFTIASNDIPLEIGRQNSATPYYFGGDMDEVYLFNRALSASEILALATVPPTPPALVSPANSATGITISPTLSWSAVSGATSYHVQVSTVADFSSTVYDQVGITATTAAISGLSNGTTYYWRANAANASGSGNWSSVWSFTTLGGSGGPGVYGLQFDGTNDYVTFGSATGVNGTIRGTNAPVWSTETGMSSPPANNRSLQFNGSDQYVTFGQATSTLGTQNFTLELWFKRTGTGTVTSTGGGGVTDLIPLLAKGRGEGETGTLNTNYALGISSGTNTLAADFEEGSGSNSFALNHPVFGTTTIQNNVWYHAAATYDRPTGVFSIYLNGNLEASVNLADNIIYPEYLSTQHASLGSALTSAGAAQGFFAGIIDEARIWNYARTQGEIQASMNSEILNSSGLLGRWGLNEGAGRGASSTATANLGLSVFTLETWFKRTGAGLKTTTGGSPAGLSAVPLLTKGRGEGDALWSNVDMNYFFGIGTDQAAGGATGDVLVADFEDLETSSGDNNHTIEGITLIQNDVWYHAAAVFDGTNWNLYLNGNLESTRSGGGTTPTLISIQHAGLGTAMTSGGTAAGFFAGVMDETRIWEVALTQQQIRDNINQQLAAGEGMVARWGLNEGTGTVATNSVSINPNGTLTNGPVWVTPGAPFNITFTPPDAPSGLIVTLLSASSIELNWTDNSGNETGFEIERSTTGSGGPFTLLTSVAANTVTYADQGLSAGFEYCYRVRAINAIGSSAYTATACATPVEGDFALDFGPSNAYVTFGQTLGATSFTIEGWFNWDGTGTANTTGTDGINIYPMITKGSPEADGSNVDANYIFGIQQTTNVIAGDFEDTDTGLNHPITGVTTLTNGQWYHGALTFDNTTKEYALYLNGNLETLITLGSTVTPRFDSQQHAALATMIRSNGTTTNGYYGGTLDEVRIWNYARTQAEIQSTINSEIVVSQSGLLGRWGLNEGSGTTVYASAGTSVNGTLTGTGSQWVTPGAPFDISVGGPETIVLQDGLNGYTGTRDTYIWETDPSTVRGGDATFVQDINVSDERRSLLLFDLSSVPAGSTIESAELQFYVGTEGQGFNMYRMLVPWNEATVTYTSIGNRHFAANGVDAETAINAAWPGVDTYTGFITVTVPASTIQDWVNGILPNNGWLMIATHADDGQQLDSRENGTQANNPRLTVYYYPPVVPTISITNVPLSTFNSEPGTPSEEQSYTVSGSNLEGDILISAPADFEVSTTSGSGFGSSVNLVQSGGSVASTRIYVRFNRPTTGVSNGIITNASSGATTRDVTVSGIAQTQASVTFQEGVNGYNGTVDTHLQWYEPSTSHGSMDYFKWDTESSGGPMYGLLRFDNLFGTGPGQIPSNAVIQSATLTYSSFDVGDYANVYEISVTWDEDATYNNFGGEAGVQADEYNGVLVTTAPGNPVGVYQIDVTSSLTHWISDPDANLGWIFYPTGTDGVQVRSSEYLPSGDRPLLTVVYLINPPAQPILVSPADGATGISTSPRLTVTVSDPELRPLTVNYYGRKAATSGADFTILGLPDTQNYTASASGGTPNMFDDQTAWAVANQAAENIVFVSHYGDVTNGNTTGEWDIADPIMGNLEGSLPGLADGIPYGIAIGNHDGAPGTTANYNSYFGLSRFTGRSYYGGHSGSDNDNNYELFSAGGMDFIVIHLEMDVAAADIQWADARLKEFPDRRAIVTSHSIIGTGNPASFSTVGASIYNELRDNPNLFLMLCGHDPGVGQRTDTYNGNTVYTLLSDYQNLTNGGNGYMRIMEFSPGSNLINVRTYSPHLGTWLTDATNQFTLPYIMTDVSSFELIGTNTNVTSGSNTSFTWPVSEGNTEYEWYVTVSNGENTVTGPVWSFTTAVVNSWTGATSTDWNTDSNWSRGVIPTSAENVSITASAGNQPVVSGSPSAVCNGLTVGTGASLAITAGQSLTVSGNLNTSGGTFTINSASTFSSGSLIVNGTSTGNVTYNRVMPGSLYRYVSSPVRSVALPAGPTYWRYDEPTGQWTETTSYSPGLGYTILANGTAVSFTGSVVTSASQQGTAPYYSYADHYTDQRTSAGGLWGGGGWNLLGNPFTSAMDALAFIDYNNGIIDGSQEDNSFDPSYEALYIYNGSDYTYVAASVPGFPGIGAFPGSEPYYTDIQVGQGFFVLANYDDVTFSFTPGMRTHNMSTPMTKSAKTEENPWPGMQLKVKYGEKENSTLLVYNEKMSTGLDPGYDVGLLSSGPDVEIYTSLVEKDNSVNFTRQALPLTGCDRNIIPVGIDFEKGGEVTFSAFTVPLANNKFWLEDRATGIFTDLTLKGYTVTLPAKTYGTGRFFIYASVNTPTGIKEQAGDNDVRIWTSQDKLIIKGNVSPGAEVAVYDLQGKLILETRLPDEALNTVSLPSGSHGVFIVKVIEGAKIHTQKVVIL